VERKKVTTISKPKEDVRGGSGKSGLWAVLFDGSNECMGGGGEGGGGGGGCEGGRWMGGEAGTYSSDWIQWRELEGAKGPGSTCLFPFNCRMLNYRTRTLYRKGNGACLGPLLGNRSSLF